MPATDKDNRPLTAELMAQVRAKLDADNLSIADLARAIGKPNNYHQVYAWVIYEAQEPRAEIALRLRAWVKSDRRALNKSLSATAARANGTRSAKQLHAV